MESPTAASSHRRGRRVHATLHGAALFALASACGPSDQSVSRGWDYGGGDRPVVSWPVMDEAGNVFVLVGEGAQASGPEADMVLELDAVSLVSLDPYGSERWSLNVAASTTVSREVHVRPIIGPGGDVWVHLGEVLTRVSASGSVSWRMQSLPPPVGHGSDVARESSLYAALDDSGVYYALPRVDIDSMLQKQQLRAIGPDGTELWAFDPGTPGFNGADFSPFPTQTAAPIIDASGRVMLGCDLCEDGSIGVARFDPDSGQPVMLFSVSDSSPPVRFRQLLWDGSATWLYVLADNYGDSLWTVTPTGATTRPDHEIQLVAESGAVWMDSQLIPEPSFVLHWGDDSIDVPPSPDILGGELTGATPVAIVEPQAVLLAAHVRIPPATDGPSESDNGLMLVDREGEVFWYEGGMFRERPPLPAIGDGFIAYIEAGTRRLVAAPAPVERVADGPWPIVGGDPQGTRSAEGK